MSPHASLPQRLTAPQLPPQWPGAVAAPTSPQSPSSQPLPRITVVTPSYNQAAFLETTVRSVLEQGYPALDYHVIDGGSTDGSVEILRHYAPWLTSWASEPDKGQVDAIMKGLARAEGEWFNWINSDDLLAPGALWSVAEVRSADLFAGCTQNFTRDALDRRRISRALTERDLVRMPVESRTRWHQPGIWYRTAALRSVGIDPALHYRFDLDLLIRYLRRFPKVEYSPHTLAWFRLHPGSKSMAYGERFDAEYRLLLTRLTTDPDALGVRGDAKDALAALDWRHAVSALQQDKTRSRLSRLWAVLLEANRTPGAWRINATYNTIGRLLLRRTG
jgi:glycosyltransferase involved in cell wall biosynthesis